MKNEWHRRHHDDEIIDTVHIEVVPRYKTSGLSGDEWRFSYLLTMSRKGTVLFERQYTSLDAAIAHLQWAHKTLFEGTDGFVKDAWTARIAADDTTCANPGCPSAATVFYRFKEIFAKNGEGPLPDKSHMKYRTGFCQRHSTRGDCGREDADSNYTLIEGEVDRPMAKDEAPAIFGGFIKLDDENGG